MTKKAYKPPQVVEGFVENGVTLTDRDLEVLTFIVESLDSNPMRIPPAYAEVKEHFGFTAVEQVRRHAARLRRAGLLVPIPENVKVHRNLIPLERARLVIRRYRGRKKREGQP